MSAVNTSEKPAYLNQSLPFTERVKHLIARMSLEEKVGLMNHPARGIPRLNIPAYNYWNEALHGVALTLTACGFAGGNPSSAAGPMTSEMINSVSGLLLVGVAVYDMGKNLKFLWLFF